MNCSTYSTPPRPQLDQLPDVLSRREVSDALGVSIATVRSWEAGGYLVPLDLPGDRILIPKAQVLACIEEASARRRPMRSSR